MNTETFHCNKYGRQTELKVGQKVECYYYHEYPDEPNEYHQLPPWKRMLDKPFKPVKMGVIIGDAGIRPYWLGEGWPSGEGKEQYLWVRFKEYVFDKAIPISCIRDAATSAKETKEFLEKNKHRIGEKGYSEESYYSLLRQAEAAEKFVNP